MKAVRFLKYGGSDVLEIVNVEAPTPKADEVLLRVHATTVNRTDCGLRSANYFVSRFFTGLFKPKKPISGSEFAGEITAVGKNVIDFVVGDRVFGFDDLHGAAHAEYMTIRSNGPIAKIPDGIDYIHAAAASEGATYALSDIEAAGVQKDHRVLVYGASGAIGSAAVQILMHMGADVTAVCGTNTIKVIRSLRPDKVVNYQKEDFTATEDRYDFIFDAVGKSSYRVCKVILNGTGKYCSTELGKGIQNPLLAVFFALTGSQKVIFPIPKINKEKIQKIQNMLEEGTYRPLLDKSYDLEDIIEATNYVESGLKVGNVVIKIMK